MQGSVPASSESNMTDSETSFVNHVVGSSCHEIRMQRDGRPGSGSHVVWMRLTADGWIKFSFDAGVFSWQEELPRMSEDEPTAWRATVEPGFGSSLANKRIVAARFLPLLGSGRLLALWFEDEATLYVHNRDDQTSVVVGWR